ncbi:DUF4129 domain-containing protein [Natronosporangium hydrolyticum]|uniref:DUF4129 domain-containing protein n=1 Tax=Natronosporangium hydrolyticum TaxID=2811111 RepID=A0A895YH95_9ACTN|nr:DUF4129 domain-containing protein [Natronosporangium hydrolyticum]QSB13078.1 DUF4129 domain-containing protein [Natronosporangium hydrolyticum]
MVDRLRRLLPILLVAVGLGLAGVAAAGPGLTGGLAPPPEEEPALVESPDDGQGEPTGVPVRSTEEFVSTDFPGWLTWPVTLFGLLVVTTAVGTVLFLLVRYLLTERIVRRPVHHRAASQPDGALRAEAVRDAVTAGLADLDAGGDPRRVVIACWLRLERVAAEAGTPRYAADTPADLVARLLAAHQVSDETLAELADAYRSARYAPDAVRAELVTRARAALADIAGQLGADQLGTGQLGAGQPAERMR